MFFLILLVIDYVIASPLFIRWYHQYLLSENMYSFLNYTCQLIFANILKYLPSFFLNGSKLLFIGSTVFLSQVTTAPRPSQRSLTNRLQRVAFWHPRLQSIRRRVPSTASPTFSTAARAARPGWSGSSSSSYSPHLESIGRRR
jgi:hypothetical protein